MRAEGDRLPGPQTDQYVRMYQVPWAQYEALLAARGESAKPRLTYVKGVLELMSPSDNHEHAKTMIARLLESYAVEMNLEFNGHGSTTFKSQPKKLGLEPDECYDFGPGKKYPDLALEVVWSNVVQVDRLAIYAAFGVREVWVWSGGELAVYRLHGVRYRRAKKSALLPTLDLALLCQFVQRPDQTKAVSEFLTAVRRGSKAR